MKHKRRSSSSVTVDTIHCITMKIQLKDQMPRRSHSNKKLVWSPRYELPFGDASGKATCHLTTKAVKANTRLQRRTELPDSFITHQAEKIFSLLHLIVSFNKLRKPRGHPTKYQSYSDDDEETPEESYDFTLSGDFSDDGDQLREESGELRGLYFLDEEEADWDQRRTEWGQLTDNCRELRGEF
jgi:hypothetical protein